MRNCRINYSYTISNAEQSESYTVQTSFSRKNHLSSCCYLLRGNKQITAWIKCKRFIVIHLNVSLFDSNSRCLDSKKTKKKGISSGASSIIIIIHQIFGKFFFVVIFFIEMENRFFRSVNKRAQWNWRYSALRRHMHSSPLFICVRRDRLEKCIIVSRSRQSNEKVRSAEQSKLILESRIWRDIRRALTVFLNAKILGRRRLNRIKTPKRYEKRKLN